MKKRTRNTILLVTLIVGTLAGFSIAEEHAIELTSAVNRKEFNIGDRIELDVTASGVDGFEILFPDVPDVLGEFSFLESHSIKSKQKKSQISGQRYVLSIYEVGSHVISPIEVQYRKMGEDIWQIAQSPQVPIEVLSLLTDEETDIRNLKGLIPFGINLLTLLIILLALALGVAGWFLWKKRKAQAQKKQAEKKIPAHEIAYKKLNELQKMDLPKEGRVKEYYTRLSDIVREYLENRFSFRAPERTTEEFLEIARNSSKIADEHKKVLRDFLFSSDMVKFAKYGPTPLEMSDSFRAAENLVEQTIPEEKEEAEK